jgi:hypothetical protein
MEAAEFAASVVASGGAVWSPLQLTKARRKTVEASRAVLMKKLFTKVCRNEPSAKFQTRELIVNFTGTESTGASVRAAVD